MSGPREVDVNPVDVGPKLYNANDGLFGRNGGPYGDEVDVRTAEFQAAAREGRAVDYDNLQPSPAIQLQNAGQQTANYNPTLIAGDDRIALNTVSENLQAPVFAEVEDKSTTTAPNELPVKDGSDL